MVGDDERDDPRWRRGYEQGRFDAGLTEYQDKERVRAAEREERGNVESRRPDASRFLTTFGALRVGDFMTAESGDEARWVEVVKCERDESGTVHVTFKVPQPIGVGYQDRWCIDRASDDPVTIDRRARS